MMIRRIPSYWLYYYFQLLVIISINQKINVKIFHLLFDNMMSNVSIYLFYLHGVFVIGYVFWSVGPSHILKQRRLSLSSLLADPCSCPPRPLVLFFWSLINSAFLTWQLRDLIVHIEAQKTVDELPGSTSSDIKGDTVLPGPSAATAATPSSSRKNDSRHGARHRKGWVVFVLP